MLVLTRCAGQTIVIDGGIEFTILRVDSKQVRIGFTAPKNIGIWRKELVSKADTLEVKP